MIVNGRDTLLQLFFGGEQLLPDLLVFHDRYRRLRWAFVNGFSLRDAAGYLKLCPG